MLTLSVLGGSSYGSYALLEALLRSIERGELAPLRVCLIARDTRRADAIMRLFMSRHPCDVYDGKLALSSHPWGASGLDGANFVLCQIRPGGMAGREQDERFALAEGIPGDEGLGPGGFANFLRSYPVLQQTASLVRDTCPGAIVLQMSSPLGLSVRLFNDHGLRCFGVCELPMTTARTIYQCSKARHGISIVQNQHFGVNHQSWLYNFTDDVGRDVTMKLLNYGDCAGDIAIDKHILLRYQAFPVHYLKLYFHPDRVTHAQRHAGSRAQKLAVWQQRLDQCLGIGGSSQDSAQAVSLLSERLTNWYEDGVVPVLAAFLHRQPRRVSLNIAMTAADNPLGRAGVVEMPCSVSESGILPLVSTPPTPVGNFTNRVLDFEERAYYAAQHPTSAAIAQAMESNPMVPSAKIAIRLAKKLVGERLWT